MSRLNMICALASFGLVGMLLTAATAGAASPVVVTTNGPVEGFTEEGLSVFLGIPYAEPPVGDLRWR